MASQNRESLLPPIKTGRNFGKHEEVRAKCVKVTMLDEEL